MENILSEIYYSPSNPGSYASVYKLYNAAKNKDSSITLKRVKDWLSKQLTYTLHKQARRNFQRNKILVTRENEQFQADLVDLQMFKNSNSNFFYILTVIDCFSRYAWAVPLRNKGAESVLNALKVVFSEQKPLKLQTDRGKEFLNSKVQTFLRNNDIHFFTTQNSNFKCAIVERFNRTLKAKMFKVFTKNGNRRYIEVLPLLLSSYNNSVHRTIKVRPIDVDENNEKEIFKNIYKVSNLREYLLKRNVEPKLKIGDKVRRKYEISKLNKGYYPNWTDNTFTITKNVKGENKTMYKIKDENNKELSQKFYPEEVQKIIPTVYRIEKVITRQKLNKIKGYIVKWLNYPESYNSWVAETDIQSI